MCFFFASSFKADERNRSVVDSNYFIPIQDARISHCPDKRWLIRKAYFLEQVSHVIDEYVEMLRAFQGLIQSPEHTTWSVEDLDRFSIKQRRIASGYPQGGFPLNGVAYPAL